MISNHVQHKKERPRRKSLQFFFLETLKNCIINEKFNTQMTTIRGFFPKIGHFFPISKKGQGTSPPPPPPLSSYAPAEVLCYNHYEHFAKKPNFTLVSLKETIWEFSIFFLILLITYFAQYFHFVTPENIF